MSRKIDEDRAFLRAEIEKVDEQLKETDSLESPVKPDAAIGRLTRIDAIQQQQMQLAIRRNRQQHLERLKAALGLLDRGKFGICSECEQEIPRSRLEIVPDAQMCSSCLSQYQ